MQENINLLYEIFDNSILNEDLADLTPDLFARQVAEDYINQLQKRGMIVPQNNYQNLLVSVQEEALDLYRKKTYGFYDLIAYQKSVIQKISENDY